MRMIHALSALPAIVLAAPLAAAQSMSAVSGPLELGEVAISEDLQVKAAEEYGERDIERLTEALRAEAEAALMGAGRLAVDGAEPEGRIELTLVDADPNRPTMLQMKNEPGLSFQSFSRGGAAIEAVLYDASGAEAGRMEYDWYSPDLRDAWARGVWSDADRTIDRFASRLASAVTGES